MAIKWTKDMKIGLDVIDNQHRQLVDYINELEEVDEHNSTAVSKVLNDVIDYTISHFSFEERLQNEAGYMFAAPHKQGHDEFVKRVIQYKERHDSGEIIASELYNMLCIWLVRHIQRDDRDYVANVKENMQKILNNKNEGSWFSRTLSVFFNHDKTFGSLT